MSKDQQANGIRRELYSSFREGGLEKIQQEQWLENQEKSPRSEDTRNRLSQIILLSLGGNRGSAAVDERKALDWVEHGTGRQFSGKSTC